jgi:RNA polymerase sigma-70 factor (sigma-E family)
MALTRRAPQSQPGRPDPAEADPVRLRPDRDEAVDLLFRAHYRDFLRLAFCLLGQRAAAEDAVQDAFVSAYDHWAKLRDPDAAVAYVRSAVINRCRSRVRDGFRESNGLRMLLADRTQVEPGAVPDESPEDVAVARSEHSRLSRAVRRLPRRQREVVVCRYYLELSVAETAQVLGIAAGSVKQHAHRGVETLTKNVGEVTA